MTRSEAEPRPTLSVPIVVVFISGGRGFVNTSDLVILDIEVVALLVTIAVTQTAKSIDDPETTIAGAPGASNCVQTARSKTKPRGKLKLPFGHFRPGLERYEQQS